MENKEKETVINIENSIKDAKIADRFFIAGFIGVIVSIILRNVDIGQTFYSGLLHGFSDGIGLAAMVVGLIYVNTNIKNLRNEKERIINSKYHNSKGAKV